MNQYLPSLRFVVSAALLLVLGAGSWFLVQRNSSEPPEVLLQEQKQKAAVATVDRVVLDTDNDGLRDWEEVIWETDPKNHDTDGDGTPDGAEVKQGRDPAKPAPNDQLTTAPKNEKGYQTLTEEVGENFRLRYLTTKGLEGGNNLSEEQKAGIVNSFIEDAYQKNGVAIVYSLANIKISQTKTGKEYGNELGGGLEKIFRGIDYTEFDVIQKIEPGMTKDEVTEVLAKLDPFIVAYGKTISFLQTTSAPPAYAALHVLFLNLNSTLKKAAEDMRSLPEDPVRGTLGIQPYIAEFENLRSFTQGLKNQFENDGVYFSAKEPGFFLNKYLYNF